MMTAKVASNKAEDDMPLEQHENVRIKGPQARNVMMQKLLRKSEVTWKWTCTFSLYSCGSCLRGQISSVNSVRM